MNQRKQDDITRTLLLCASLPAGLVVMVLLLDGLGEIVRWVT